MKAQIISALFLIASVGLFFLYVDPQVGIVSALNARSDELEGVVVQAEELKNLRDALLAKYNAIPSKDLERLAVVLPDESDVVRLLVDINTLARALGAGIKEITVDASNIELPSDSASEAPSETTTPIRDKLRFVELTFAIEATYETFLQFISSLERSLHTFDISEIAFSSIASVDEDSAGGAYSFTVSVRKYVLR
jgi:hypothetical protein